MKLTLAQLWQLGAFIIAAVTLAFGIDARIDAKAAAALGRGGFTTKLEAVTEHARLELHISRMQSEIVQLHREVVDLQRRLSHARVTDR